MAGERRSTSIPAAAVLFLLALAGGSAWAAPLRAAAVPAAAWPDAAAGQTAPAGAPPRRIITMAPNLTEIVFALGAGERLVAVSEYSEFPPEAKTLPRVGGFINPDIEQLLALHPDLVILRDYSKGLEEKLRRFEVPVLPVRDEAIADILSAIREIGAALGASERAGRLAASLEQELETYRRRPEPARRPRVLLVAGRSPGTLQDLYAPGAGTFLDELIRLAGGANLFGDSKIPYPKLSKEEIIARDPEVILEPVSATSYAAAAPDPEVWKELGGVSAVRSGRIHVLPGDHLLIPGPRLGQALRDMEAAIRGSGAGPP
jgi:iron complex transport system substrate-binding protein